MARLPTLSWPADHHSGSQDGNLPGLHIHSCWGLRSDQYDIWQCWLFESRILKVGYQISGERLALFKTWCWDNLLTAIWKEQKKLDPYLTPRQMKDWDVKLKNWRTWKNWKLPNSLLPLMWKPYKSGIHRTEGYKLFFNFQMPPTSCILGRGTLECFELL